MLTIESSARIDRPVDEVFGFVTDPSNEPEWHTDVLEVSAPEPPLRPGSRMTWVLNFMGRRDMHMQVVDLQPNSLERLRAEAPLMGMQPTITYEFATDSGGTRFTRRVEMDPKGGWRVMTPMMKSLVKKRNASFVENLKKRLSG